MTKPLLNVSHLMTQFQEETQTIEVVKDISFSINAGETVALVGESGSGKSITALSIMRLLPPSGSIQQGDIVFQGEHLLQLTETEMRRVRGTGIGMIFQEPMTSLNPVMTIGQQIAEAVINAKPELPSNTVNQQVAELLELVGINDYQNRLHEYPHQFSGGMRQRVMIAIALAGEPELLIADEPTTALDVTIQAQVLELIKDIQQKRNMAVLLITHDLGVVHGMADRVVVMRHGEILETASSQRFFSQPQHTYSQGLFEAIPSLAKRGKRLSMANNEQGNDHETQQTITTEPAQFTEENQQPLLSVSHLKTYFPIKKGVFRRTIGYVEAVNGVSLKLHQGKTLAIVGESGSGKTTLAKTLIRLLKPTEGQIEFSGHNLQQLSSKQLQTMRADFQIVFQDPYSSMNPRMLIRDILAEGMKALKINSSAQQREQKMLELLHLVGLDKDSLNRYPHQFSGGQRQRIAIARALTVNPKLIICDEPTSALDVSVQAQILNLLKDLQQRLNLSYLFISHDISVVSYIADDIAVMYKGEIVEQGSVEKIILQPEHSYTKTLMSAVPTLYKTKAC